MTWQSVQVYNALQYSQSLLDGAKHEIYVGRFRGRPYYIPRCFASLACRGHARKFPYKRLEDLMRAVRRVARVQLSLISLFEDGVSPEVVSVIRNSFPEHLLSCLIKCTANVLEECLTAFPNKATVKMGYWQKTDAYTSMLMSCAGLQRRRARANMHAQGVADAESTDTSESEAEDAQGALACVACDACMFGSSMAVNGAHKQPSMCFSARAQMAIC